MADPEKQSVRNIKPFGLRIQPDLKERLSELAQREGKSLNEFISSALEKLYGTDSQSRMIVLRLPSNLYAAIEARCEYGFREPDSVVIEVLKEHFPASYSIEKAQNLGEQLFETLDTEVDESRVSDAVLDKLRSIILELSDLHLDALSRVGYSTNTETYNEEIDASAQTSNEAPKLDLEAIGKALSSMPADERRMFIASLAIVAEPEHPNQQLVRTRLDLPTDTKNKAS